MTTRFLAVGAAVLVVAALAGVQAGGDEPKGSQAPGQSAPKSKTTPTKGTRVMKTDAEWRQLLTDQEYYVTRRKGTEPAFSGRYWNHHGDGYYRCVCCNTVLFDSKTKFESGTGWPSFYAPVSKAVVKTETDRSNFMIRTEVLCRVCDAHLGHVFRDGPRPTGLRFCMNSASLKFQDRAQAEAEAAAKAVLESDPQPDPSAEPTDEAGNESNSEPTPNAPKPQS
nr:peptide-methionine (R)-S-oxide reductase MsrB [Tautonia marina]